MNSVEEGRVQLVRLISETGLEAHLSDFGIGEDDIEHVVEFGCNQKRASNNPRRLTAQGLREVLRLSL